MTETLNACIDCGGECTHNINGNYIHCHKCGKDFGLLDIWNRPIERETMTEKSLLEKLRPKSFEANGDTWIRFEDMERIMREHTMSQQNEVEKHICPHCTPESGGCGGNHIPPTKVSENTNSNGSQCIMTDKSLIEKLRESSTLSGVLDMDVVERIVREHEAGGTARLLRYSEAADKQNSMVGLVEVFEDMIRYNGENIWHGNASEKSEKEINAIIEEYKKKREAQKGNSRAWYDITDMTGEIHRIPIEEAEAERIARKHKAQETPSQYDTLYNAWECLKRCEGKSMDEDRPYVDRAWEILDKLVRVREYEARSKTATFGQFSAPQSEKKLESSYVHKEPHPKEGMPYPLEFIEQWCGDIDNIDISKTYNVTGTHLRQILESYRILAAEWEKKPHPFTDEKKSREAFEKWFTEKYEWQPFPENHPRFWRDMFIGWQGAISAYERAKND